MPVGGFRQTKRAGFFLMTLIYWMEEYILLKNTAANKEVGTEVNAKKTKYMVTS